MDDQSKDTDQHTSPPNNVSPDTPPDAKLENNKQSIAPSTPNSEIQYHKTPPTLSQTQNIDSSPEPETQHQPVIIQPLEVKSEANQPITGVPTTTILEAISPKIQPADQQTSMAVPPTVSSGASQTVNNNQFSGSVTDNKGHKKLLIVAIMCLVVVILAGAGAYYWYSKQDHSVYSKLTSENYSSNGLNVSFKYPSVMQKNSAAVAQAHDTVNYGALVEYVYKNSSNQKVIEFASFLNISAFLEQTGLTPDQATKQIEAKSGSYVNLLNGGPDANLFSKLYPACDGTILNVNGQTNMICAVQNPGNNTGYITTLVIGLTQNTQYSLSLEMPNSVWLAHQKDWKQVEKSFTYY